MTHVRASRTVPPRRWWAWIGAALPCGVAAWVAFTGVLDARALREVRAAVAPSDAEPGPALESARAALARLTVIREGPLWRHAWLRLTGNAGLAEATGAVHAALERTAALLDAREANRAWLADLTVRLEQAATLGQTDALHQALLAGGPRPEAPLPVGAIADVQRRVDAVGERLQQDDARNAEVLAAAREALADSAAGLGTLQRLARFELPRPDARAPLRTTDGAAVRAEARARRDRILEARIAALEEEAARAPSAAQVAVALVALERDPDLRAAGADLAGLAPAKQRIGARRTALAAWERERRRLEERLDANDPAGAAHALASLSAPDEARARELGALRVGFPGRAAYALARGVVERAERGDWSGARRLLHAARHDPALHAALDATSGGQVARAEAALGPSEDRALYEAFRAARSVALAERYLAGWPVLPRRMAPAVLAYLEWLRAPVTVLELTGVEWDVVGANRSPVPDLPDATVELWSEGGEALRVVVEDIADGGRTALDPPPQIRIRGTNDALVRLGAVVRISLRDSARGAPIAIGALATTSADLRASRSLVIPVVDPAWSARPHRLLIRAWPEGAPLLPPWPLVPPAATQGPAAR